MKRIYCILPIVYGLLVSSCGSENKQTEIPSNVLSREKMAQVITDIHIAEAEANLQTLPDSTSKKSIDFSKIYAKDSITKQQYEESLSFYMDHPELLDSIYVQVLNELSKMQGNTK